MAYIGKTRDPAFQFYADQTTVDLAKKLRRKMTPYEKVLWQRLRTNKTAGFKFRRQHPIKFFIADFYCHEARLVIEVDGPVKGLPPLQGEGRGGVHENKSSSINIYWYNSDQSNYYKTKKP